MDLMEHPESIKLFYQKKKLLVDILIDEQN
jgi:hypothetical protein